LDSSRHGPAVSAREYVSGPDPEAITADQTAVLSKPLAENIQRTVAEFETGQSVEALCAKDADKLECLLQAIEYREAGYGHIQGWVDSCYAALRTESARRLAQAALDTSPLAWRGR
jgi:putative hydrolase of HD superfamily